MFFFLRKYFFTLLATSVILVLVLIPLSNLPKIESPLFAIDKAVHLLIFMLWEIIFFIESKGQINKYQILMTGMAFGISTEVFQIFTKDRTFDLIDAVYDCCGLFIGLGLWIAISSINAKMKTSKK